MILGTLVGAGALLFVLANDGWVVVRIPALPWSTDSHLFAYEARLSGIVIIAFCCGALVSLIGVAGVGRKARRVLKETDNQRVHQLETELERVTRLLAVTRDEPEDAENPEYAKDPEDEKDASEGP